jgi:phage baseplate assembly protein W
MAEKFINIEFPFQDDEKGKFLFLNNRDKKAIKADLIHLLFTNKNERLYLPDFGANLRQYLFEQNDGQVSTSVKGEIQTAIAKYIPNLVVNSIVTKKGEEGDNRNEHHLLVTLDYTVTDGAFAQSDTIEIEI